MKTTDPETALRKLWTAQGVPQDRQDQLIVETVAKARPGAMVGPFQIDRTPEGAQCVLPGAERASDKTMAQRRADAPLRPKKNQRPCDAGLFSDERDQTSLI